MKTIINANSVSNKKVHYLSYPDAQRKQLLIQLYKNLPFVADDNALQSLIQYTFAHFSADDKRIKLIKLICHHRQTLTQLFNFTAIPTSVGNVFSLDEFYIEQSSEQYALINKILAALHQPWPASSNENWDAIYAFYQRLIDNIFTN